MVKGLKRSLSRGDATAQTVMKQDLAFADVAVSVSATGSAAGFGSAVVSGFPEGNILFLGATSYVSLAGSGSDANLDDNWSGTYSASMAPLADAAIDADAERNLIYSSTFGPAAAELVGAVRGEKGGVTVYDNTDGSLEVNLNVVVDAANIVDDATVELLATGVIHIAYIILGDD